MRDSQYSPQCFCMWWYYYRSIQDLQGQTICSQSNRSSFHSCIDIYFNILSIRFNTTITPCTSFNIEHGRNIKCHLGTLVAFLCGCNRNVISALHQVPIAPQHNIIGIEEGGQKREKGDELSIHTTDMNKDHRVYKKKSCYFHNKSY